MIQKVSEEQVLELSGNTMEFPVIIKQENCKTQSAVCLKKMPKGYLLGLSSETEKRLDLFYSENYAAILHMCHTHIKKMMDKDLPF